jgi:hypothetical protein
MYDRLITNIPKHLMQYSDQAFLPQCLLFPTREDVQDYLIQYSQDVRHLIIFSTQVEDISLSQENGQDRWSLTARSTIDSKVAKNPYMPSLLQMGTIPFHLFLPFQESNHFKQDIHPSYHIRRIIGHRRASGTKKSSSSEAALRVWILGTKLVLSAKSPYSILFGRKSPSSLGK